MQNYNEKYEEFKYEIISETKDGKVYEFGLAKGKDKLEVAIDAGGKVITKENAKEDEED